MTTIAVEGTILMYWSPEVLIFALCGVALLMCLLMNRKVFSGGGYVSISIISPALEELLG